MQDSLPSWLFNALKDIDKSQLPHALMISGRKGIGKYSLAEYFCKSILCLSQEMKVCGKCNHCNFVLKRNHPDFYILEDPDNKNIPIKNVRELKEKIYQSPFLGRNKVCLIRNCNLLSQDAIDTLLKVLEEPPENTFFILVTDLMYLMPLTIKSRCTHIKIPSPTTEESIDWFSGEYDMDSIQTALSLCSNRPFAAKEYLSSGILDMRNVFLKEISSIIKGADDFIVISEKWNEDVENLQLKVEWMANIIEDSIRYKNSAESSQLFHDTRNITTYIGQKVNALNLFSIYRKTNEVRGIVSKNSNNLKIDYQLLELFNFWEKKLGISSL
tara:strand:- start:6627 stop:7610 length:984 start_codon:yes stop_codon:yes gene_type:complete